MMISYPFRIASLAMLAVSASWASVGRGTASATPDYLATSGEACAFCTDTPPFQYGGGWRASWQNNGAGCTPGGSNTCAVCEPSCSASAAIGPDNYEVVQAWYDDNKCLSWMCGGGGGEPEGLELALALEGDAQIEALVELLSESDGRVRLNQSRDAIQAYGCRDQVFAQFDLDPGVTRRLARALAAAAATGVE